VSTDTLIFLGYFLWLIVTLFLVYKLKWKIVPALWGILRALPLVGCGTRFFVGLILLPGIVLHEYSHALLARLVVGDIDDMSITPKKEAERLKLGYVTHKRVNPLFAGLISLAPLLVGSLVPVLILRYGFDVRPPLPYDGPIQFLETLYNTGQHLIQRPLLIYFLFVCGNGVLPSATDYKGLLGTFPLLLVLGMTAYVLGTHTIPCLSDPERWLQGLNMLILTFTTVLVLDAVVVVPLWILFGLFGRDC